MALLNINHLKTLVAIGEIDRKKGFVCRATGFLVGFIAHNSKDPVKRSYYIFLVTNRHVFEGKEGIYLRFNKNNGGVEIFAQSLSFSSNESRWLAHKNINVDLALLHVSPQVLQQHKVDYSFLNEEIFAYHRNFLKIGIEVGDEIYILGFPMGIAGELQNRPYVKGGIISRIDKELLSKNKAFLIDSSIFPGNSGSPVILKPTITSLDGTSAVSQIYLLGVVSRYLPYEEALYTHQTNPPSIVSLERENSGLSYVIPMDFVRHIFNNWISQRKKLEKTQRQVQTAQREVKSSYET